VDGESGCSLFAVAGQDPSKITMPVAVNEPLSFLQRMVEYLEYAELLSVASQTDDPIHRLEVSAPLMMISLVRNYANVVPQIFDTVDCYSCRRDCFRGRKKYVTKVNIACKRCIIDVDRVQLASD